MNAIISNPSIFQKSSTVNDKCTTKPQKTSFMGRIFEIMNQALSATAREVHEFVTGEPHQYKTYDLFADD